MFIPVQRLDTLVYYDTYIMSLFAWKRYIYHSSVDPPHRYFCTHNSSSNIPKFSFFIVPVRIKSSKDATEKKLTFVQLRSVPLELVISNLLPQRMRQPPPLLARVKKEKRRTAVTQKENHSLGGKQ